MLLVYMQTKLCDTCNVLKEHHFFSSNKISTCSTCKNRIACNKYKEKNKDALKLKRQNRYLQQKDDPVFKAKQKQYLEKNKASRLQNMKEYCDKNRDRIRAYEKNKRNTNEPFRLQQNIQTILYHTLGSISERSRPGTATQIIGCSWDDYAAYLNDRLYFVSSNIPLQVDHVIPRGCPFFDFNNHDHIRACFHFTNSQFLPKPLNQSKNDKLPPGFDQTAFDEWLQKQLRQIERIQNENLSYQTVLSLQQSGDFQ